MIDGDVLVRELFTGIEIDPNPNLEYQLTSLLGRMVDFKILDQIGRVYFCRFLPLNKPDPTLPYVVSAGKRFDDLFTKMANVLTNYPELNTEHSIKLLVNYYDESRQILQTQLTEAEFEFYTSRMEGVITNPMKYLPLYIRKPELFYLLLFMSVASITLIATWLTSIGLGYAVGVSTLVGVLYILQRIK